MFVRSFVCSNWIISLGSCVDQQLEDVRSYTFGPQTVGCPRSEKVAFSSVVEPLRNEQT